MSPKKILQIWSEPLKPLLPALDSGLGSALESGYSVFGSSRLLAQVRLGAPDLGSGINSMLGSAQLGAWLGLSS